MLPWMLRRTHRRIYTKQGEAYRRETPQELLDIVQRRIMERLVRAKRDYRGDLRQTPTERMLQL